MPPVMIFDQETADTICDRISCGESLRGILRDPEMPSHSTVFKWLARVESFADQYARAREAQADAIFDEILDISDNAKNDWMERHDDGAAVGWQLNGDHVRRTQLRVDARKWMAGKLRPKKYGDKITAEHTGPGGGPMTFQTVYESKPDDR